MRRPSVGRARRRPRQLGARWLGGFERLAELRQVVDLVAADLERDGADTGEVEDELVLVEPARDDLDYCNILERELGELKDRVERKSRQFSVLLDQAIR